MKIIFRTDASSEIGSGHLIRCLTLAKKLTKLGKKCKFILRNYNDNLIKKIRKENIEVTILSNPNKGNLSQNNNFKTYINTNGLGTNWKNDAKQTINVLTNEKTDWLIVDHYGLDVQWEKKLRSYTKNIMVIDDLANRKHDCDLLLDQNLVANFKNRYNSLLPKYCSILLGPQYALLQAEYKDLHLKKLSRTGLTKRILVYFGGGDQNNLIEMTLSAFLKLNRKDILLDVVIGLDSQQKNKIKRLFKKNKNIKIFGDQSSLATLMLKADIAIGACGTTTWERCCLGLPSIVITVANNQKPVAKELQRQGLIIWLGHYDEVTSNLIYISLKNHIDQNLKTWARACKFITDGCGVEKVASVLTLSSKTKFRTRLMKTEDTNLLLRWANDPLVRKNALHSRVITKKVHKKWFFSRLNNPKIFVIFILETKEKVPIGQVRFEKKDGKFYISYSVASFARGKNISYKLLKTAIYELKKKNRKIKLVAKVKKDNLPSNKVFEKIGFKKNCIVKNLNIFTY